MLIIDVPESEFFNEELNEFQKVKGWQLQLEHSLVSISKWESKWKKPFLSSDKTAEESLDYIKCMTVNHGVADYLYLSLNSDQLQKITDYIGDAMTATTFTNEQVRGKKEIVTAELIYYWMIAQNIPYECRKWHLNKLLTLIRVCAIKNAPPKKMSKREIMQQNSSLNAARKAKLNTRG